MNSRPARFRGLQAIDSRTWLFALLLAATVAFGIDVQSNLDLEMPAGRQRALLNPDARLYFGLADNLTSGVGFHDTTRNKDVLPAVGHPYLISLVCNRLGLTPARQAWIAVWLSLAFVVLAVRIHTRSNTLALAAAWVYAGYLAQIRWLAGNVETSIVASITLFLLCLAWLYRSQFRVELALGTGVVLAAALLIRPIYLYLVHAATAAVLLAFAYQRWGLRAAPSRFVRGWLLVLLTAQALMASVTAYSNWEYGDARLISGSYGGWVLWLANNRYMAPDQLYKTKARHPPEYRKALNYFNTAEDWHERQAYFMKEVTDYWIEQPGRAIYGWLWRLQHFLGLHSEQLFGETNPKRWGPRIHPYAVAAGLMLFALRIRRAWQQRSEGIESMLSLGVVAALMFITYASFHSLVSYTGFRYVTGCVPTGVIALALLAGELWPSGAQSREISRKT